MHFLRTNTDPEKQDFAYWWEVSLAFLGMVSIVAGIGHFLDWLKTRKPTDWEISLGFVVAYGILLLVAPKRIIFVITSLLGIVVCGVVNAFLLRSMAGLPIILPCALLAYLLLRWKGHLLK
jgi:hypothetical protein